MGGFGVRNEAGDLRPEAGGKPVCGFEVWAGAKYYRLGQAWLCGLLLLSCVVAAPPSAVADNRHVTLQLKPHESRPDRITGRVVVEDQQGGLLLEDRFGAYWTFEATEIEKREADSEPFAPSSADEMAESLKAAAGGPSITVKTKHYVVVSRASRAYASWCSTMLERLRTGFLAHWERQKVPLAPRESLLPILVLQNKGQFREFAIRDGAAEVADAYGYYSARTNRVVLYDLTADQPGPALGEATQRDEITRRLSRSPASVATVVHEAVHQLAFNTGLQVRYADNPMWVSEGLAMYFETPDFSSGSRWTTVGQANPWRLAEFQKSLNSRKADALATLIQGENRFRDPASANAAYAESWALVHFLATKRRPEWNEYVLRLRDRQPLVFDSAEERAAGFKKVFGEDLEALDAKMTEHVRGLRVRR